MRNFFVSAGFSLILAFNADAALKDLKPGWNLFSPQQDIELGREASSEVIKKKPLVNNPQLDAYVARIGQILSRAPHAGNWPYEFHVINDKNVNAFSLPGGFIFVNTGAIDACDNEAQFAGVLAHEMSHVVLRHGTYQITKAAPVQLAAMLAGALFGRGMMGQLARAGIGLTAGSVLLKFSRSAEAEADYNGVEILSDVGYNPLEMAHFFEKLASKASSSRLSEYLSDHPNPGNRVQAIQDEVREVPQKRYVTSIVGGFPGIKEAALHIPPPQGLRSADAHPGAAPPARPSSELKEFRGQGFTMMYPANWRVFGDQQSNVVTIAPAEGIVQSADGGTSVGYGIEASYYLPQSQSVDLERDTKALLQHLAEANPELRSERSEPTDVGGRRALITILHNRSPFENETEADWLVTTPHPNGLFYMIFIAPQSELDQVRGTFERILQSVHFN